MRRVLAFVLLLLGALATVLAATSVWASRTLLDESGWEKRAAAVANDPAVATAISDAIVERIPAKLTTRQERQLRVAVGTALLQPQVQVAWARLNRAAATALLDVARGEPGDHVNANGDVVLDAEPLLQSLADAEGAAGRPAGQRQAREIVLVRASKLDPLRRAADISNLAPPVLIALAIILLGLGAVAARTVRVRWRRRSSACWAAACRRAARRSSPPATRRSRSPPRRWPTRSSPRRSTPPSVRSRSSSAAPAWWRSAWSPSWPACGRAPAPCNACRPGVDWPAMSFVAVCRLDEIVDGRGVVRIVNGAEIALMRSGATVLAIGNLCPHRGGQLGDGRVEDGRAICPLHGWDFDLRTGISPYNPADAVPAYPTRLRDGAVEVDASAVRAAPPRPDVYLGPWIRRGAGDRGMHDVHGYATGAGADVQAMGSLRLERSGGRRPSPSLDDIVFKPAQLDRLPLLGDVEPSTPP